MESNPPSELLTSAVVRNLFTRCQRVVRKPIRYVTIDFQDRSGPASLRCKNRAEISVLCVNKSPIRYGFCDGARAIRYSVDIASVSKYNNSSTPSSLRIVSKLDTATREYRKKVHSLQNTCNVDSCTRHWIPIFLIANVHITFRKLN